MNRHLEENRGKCFVFDFKACSTQHLKIVLIQVGVFLSSLKHFLVCLFIMFRSMNEIKNLQYLPRTSEPREVLFEDRTRAHADHVGQGFDWQSTAAVGVLKAVQFGEW